MRLSRLKPTENMGQRRLTRYEFIGKPNPLMMRSALRQLGVHSEDTVMIGDRMDTDIIAGIESGMQTILVLSGVTRREDVERFPYRPSRIVDSVEDIEPC
jgi:NagD protein